MIRVIMTGAQVEVIEDESRHAVDIIELKPLTKDLPNDYIGYLVLGKNAYTVERAIEKFIALYKEIPERAYRWREYLLIPRNARFIQGGTAYTNDVK